jgi:hypothetical protein
MKYFITGAFSSAFFLYGVALLYGISGSTWLMRIAPALHPSSESAALGVLGVALLLVGFGFKVASAPFHMWVPDVYEGAPTTVTALMSAGVKAAAFGAFLRVFLVPLAAVSAQWRPAVAVLAVVSMVLGNLGALAQSNLKRMLAYSSIAHAGYLLTAVVACAGRGGRGRPLLPRGLRGGEPGRVRGPGRPGQQRRARAAVVGRPGGAGRAPPRPGRGPDRVPHLPDRGAGVRGLRGEVLPLQRRGLGGLRGPGGGRRPHERRLRVLLPARGGRDVHARAHRRGHLGPGHRRRPPRPGPVGGGGPGPGRLPGPVLGWARLAAQSLR